MERTQAQIPIQLNELSLAQKFPDLPAIIMIGSLGSGKSTLLSSLMGADQSGAFAASEATIGCTQSFEQMITPNFAPKETILIDSPGLNDPNLPLQIWVNRYNAEMAKTGISLCVLLIKYRPRPSDNDKQNLAVLAELFENLPNLNFVVIFNFCKLSFTKKHGLDFFNTAMASLEENSKKKLPQLTEEQIFIIRAIDEETMDQDKVEKKIAVDLSNELKNRLSREIIKIQTKEISIENVFANAGETLKKLFEQQREAYLAIQKVIDIKNDFYEAKRKEQKKLTMEKNVEIFRIRHERDQTIKAIKDFIASLLENWPVCWPNMNAL